MTTEGRRSRAEPDPAGTRAQRSGRAHGRAQARPRSRRERVAQREGSARTVLRALRHIPAYMRLLIGLLFDSRVAMLDKLLVLGALAYVVSPVDLIPAVVPVFGELDVLFVLTLALQHLVAHADEDVLLDHWVGDPEELSNLNIGRVMAAVSFFLPLGIRSVLRRRLGRKGRAARPVA